MSPTKTKEPNGTGPDLDAFPDAEADETDDTAIATLEAATGGTSGGASPFASLELMATLQDVKVSKKSNGDNYEAIFEVDIEGFVRLAVEAAKGKSGYDVTWNKVHVGIGAEVKRFAGTRDADGEMHYKAVIHLPQSEISRSLGRIGVQLGVRTNMVLEPMQGTLGLADGSQVDLTAKAD